MTENTSSKKIRSKSSKNTVLPSVNREENKQALQAGAEDGEVVEVKAAPSQNDSTRLQSGDEQKLSQSDLKIREDYESLVPRPTPSEFNLLELSLNNDGQRIPIVVNPKGELLDGHCRFRILKKLGRDVLFEIRSFGSEDEEREFIRKSAVDRRQLSVFQKVVLAQPRLVQERQKAKERQRAGKKATFTSNDVKVRGAVAIVAKEYGIPQTTFERCCHIIDNATRAEISDLERGLVTINGLYKDLLTKKRSKDGNISNPTAQMLKGESVHTTSWDPIVETFSNPAKSKDGDVQSNENGSKDLNPAIEKDTLCQHCHLHFPRGELKRVLLCMDCRKALGIRW